jgi:hypothetical protein
MFIFALIAAAASSGTFLTTGWPVWIAAGSSRGLPIRCSVTD